jgi:hypothetical protein
MNQREQSYQIDFERTGICSEHTLFRKLTNGKHSKKGHEKQNPIPKKKAQAPNGIRYSKEARIKQLGSACILRP